MTGHRTTLPSPEANDAMTQSLRHERCDAFIVVAAKGARRFCTHRGPHETHAVQVGSRKWFWR